MTRKSRNRGWFAGIPKEVMNHPDYHSLSGNAVKLLLDAAWQYRGMNNGKLCFVWNQLKTRGWKSEGTINRAKKELLEKDLIRVSKKGGKLEKGKWQTTFYAISWQNVDDIEGFDMELKPNIKPLRSFK